MAVAAPFIAMGVSAIGTGVSAYGAYKSAKAQQQANLQNAEIEEKNAVYAEEQAKYLEEDAAYYAQKAIDTAQTGKREVRTFRQNVELVKGSQQAGFGGSGVVVDSGSSSAVVQDTAKFGEVDALTLQHNYAVQVEEIDRQSTQLTREAKRQKDVARDYRRNAKNLRAMRSNALLDTAGAVISGGARTVDYAGKVDWSKL